MQADLNEMLRQLNGYKKYKLIREIVDIYICTAEQALNGGSFDE